MLSPSDSIRMSVAQWPLPMITAETRDQDWFVSITEKLMWNAIIKVDRKKMQMAPLPAPSPECAAHGIGTGERVSVLPISVHGLITELLAGFGCNHHPQSLHIKQHPARLVLSRQWVQQRRVGWTLCLLCTTATGLLG